MFSPRCVSLYGNRKTPSRLTANIAQKNHALKKRKLDFPQITREKPGSRGRPFKGIWTDIPKMRISSVLIIKDFDVIEDIGSSQITGFIDPFSDSFFFQATEEGFSNRIIPTVTSPAHAGGCSYINHGTPLTVKFVYNAFQ